MFEHKQVYIIGDVHGCYTTLMQLIEQLPNKEKSHLIFVGDLIDRGKDSARVVEYVKNGGYDCIKGNHEAVMVEAYETKNMCDWLSYGNGGDQTKLSYINLSNVDLQEHLTWMKSLPDYLEYNIKDENNKTLFVTHGFGLPFYQSKNPMYLRNNRISKSILYGVQKPLYPYEKNYLHYPIFNVFGHEHFNEPWITNHFCGIVTGCVYGGALSALEYPSKRVFTQKYVG
ncbi:Calcineurin-like phosphoesterase [Sulfurospirillum barnesii SES-3]|uniref:Calcineurin-like phosphoesterase n=2 Tax=Sulfurospirillum barnesii TaxID=44674 RepID=I3XX78_SULBS|nr:Calcineurin-like phosphoesterase [Sulfurospirillum barnesii SES-3]